MKMFEDTIASIFFFFFNFKKYAYDEQLPSAFVQMW